MPNHFAKLSAGESGDALPKRRLAAFFQNSAFLMDKSNCQKHHELDRWNRL